MNDDLNLWELSTIYREATDIGSPSPHAVKRAIDVFPSPRSEMKGRMVNFTARACAFLFFLLICMVALEESKEQVATLGRTSRQGKALLENVKDLDVSDGMPAQGGARITKAVAENRRSLAAFAARVRTRRRDRDDNCDSDAHLIGKIFNDDDGFAFGDDTDAGCKPRRYYDDD